MRTDESYMARVLCLARKGAGYVSPNPKVGALVVRNGRTIACGYHSFFGGPHAESDALSKLRPDQGKGGTLYVNLEPCDHYGKTPPCTDSIILSGMRRVVIGIRDPNPLVSGKGILRLRNAGIEVTEGVLKTQCETFNAPYIKYMTKHKPFITLKIAQTLDGQIATRAHHSRWITGESSRRRVQKMRREHDAVLVGVNTILHDDPSLTIRCGKQIPLRRIVLDSTLKIPMNAMLFSHQDPQNTFIATSRRADPLKVEALTEKKITVWICEQDQEGRVDLESLWEKITGAGMTSVLVEGGRETFTSFLKSGAVDCITVFVAPKILGNGIGALGSLDIDLMDRALTFTQFRWMKSGEDMAFRGWM